MVVERKPCVGAVYFYTTFIRAITSLLQIRQVARLRSTTCNLHGLSPTQKEHTNNPVQKPNFRGHAAGDGEVTRAGGRQMAAPTGKGTPTDDHSRRS